MNPYSKNFLLALVISLLVIFFGIGCPFPALAFEYVIDDFTVYQPESIPAPQRGVPYIDPNFHTTITRITDKNADAYYGRGIVNAYATHDIENSDGRYIILHSLGDRWYLYDALNFNLIKQLAIPQDSTEPECRWDYQDPNIFYYRYGTGFYRYNVSTDTKTLLHDFKSEYPSATMIRNQYEGDSSADSRYWAFKVYQSSTVLAIVTYDKETNKVLGSYDTTGMSGNEERCDWVSISPSGRRVVVAWYYSTGLGTTAYDLDFSNPLSLIVQGYVPHADLGIDADGNDVFVFENYNDDKIHMKNIITGEDTHILTIDYYTGSQGEHISANNVKTPGWALFSTYATGVTANSWADKHLFMVELNKNKCWTCPEKPRIWRIAHTHQPYYNYWTEAFATINNEGTKVFWASNWDKVGTDEGLEVYQVELPKTWWSDLSSSLPDTTSPAAPTGVVVQ